MPARPCLTLFITVLNLLAACGASFAGDVLLAGGGTCREWFMLEPEGGRITRAAISEIGSILEAHPSGKYLMVPAPSRQNVAGQESIGLIIGDLNSNSRKNIAISRKEARLHGSRLSPDSSLIALPCRDKLYLLKVEDGTARNLQATPEGEKKWIMAFSWSPNGKHVAFYEADSRFAYKLCVLNIDDGMARALTEQSAPSVSMWLGEHMEGQEPIWSADGKSIYFVAHFGALDKRMTREPQPKEYETATPKIFRIELEGGRTEMLVTGCNPRLNPSYDYIYFYDCVGHKTKIIHLATGHVRDINEHCGGSVPAPSPDGKVLAVIPLTDGMQRMKVNLLGPDGSFMRHFELEPDSASGNQPARQLGSLFWISWSGLTE